MQWTLLVRERRIYSPPGDRGYGSPCTSRDGRARASCVNRTCRVGPGGEAGVQADSEEACSMLCVLKCGVRLSVRVVK